MLRTIMHKNLSRMAYLEVIIFLCSMVTFMVSNCETESETSNKKANLPELSSELDLSSIEASIENEESLKKIVKRLASEKNGVTGQPGVDFPALTTIPATSFSCRGLKGGYYADLETNCQVFHICDNGRKISFLCPNGTIFQQSQLICDWWFKVDCSKSTELYEQSSEQLFEEERRRAESRKSKLDYPQSVESGAQQDYYDVQNLSYDGKQNGRIKPYEEPPQENQVQPNRERIKSSRHFDSGNNFSQESNSQRDGNQLFGGNGFHSNNQPSNLKQQLNQFTRNTDEGNVNRYSTTSQDYHNAPKKAQNYYVTNRNSNSQRDDKGALKRLKFKGLNRSNSTSSQRVTPAYTESTTFRGSNTSPVKESQQFAESAAFVGNRGNRFNENTGNTHQYYYQLYINRDSTTRNSIYDSTTWRRDNENDVSTQRNDYPSFTDTTSTYYETTTQYSTVTTTPPCNDEITTESSLLTNPSTYSDTQPITESLLFANSNYEYRGNAKTIGTNVRSSFVDKNYYDGNDNRDNNRATIGNTGTVPSTTRSYVTTDVYRQNTITPSSSQQRYTSYFSLTPTASFRSSNFGRSTERPAARTTIDNQSNRLNNDSIPTSKNPFTVSPGYRQNLISTTTEKPFRSTLAYQQNTVTEKDLSPYDRSFTYKQGKVMSTLGPYIPFTRNYAYSSSSTTSKPTPYTPTVPTYTTTYTSPRTLIPKLKYPTPTSSSKIRSNAARFSEREHALSMLHSLKNLEHSVPSLSETLKENERASNVSVPPAPSTLHSLALYFSTATENFDSNETTDSSINIESAEDVEESALSKKSNGTVQVPTSILTRHTIDSYTELFKLNEEVETNNVTTEDRLDNSSGYREDYNDDLELQQSGGSLDDLRKTNSTRLRELAQVFTHALSAYLLDPESFKKVLTEIRPTEPSKTTEENDLWSTTTPYLIEDNTSPTRERDEVLDFSDDGNDIRQKLTTIYPTTFEPPTTTTQESVYDTFSTSASTYYTTPKVFSQDGFEYSTNLISLSPVTGTYFETSVPPTESTYTLEPNSTPYDSSGFYNQNNEVDKGNAESTVTNSYVSSDETGNQNRVGGFQNNSVTTVTESLDKLFASTPISDNYVVSPTPPSPSVFVHMVTYNWNKKSTSKKPEQQLNPPFFDDHPEAIRKDNDKILGSLKHESYSSTPMSTHSVRSTTFDSTTSYETSTNQPHKIPRHKSLLAEPKPIEISLPTLRSSYMKFRNLYNRVDEHNIETTEKPITTTAVVTELTTSTTNIIDTTPCANDDSNDSFESVDQKEDSKILDNDHWTSSPAVTHLWETSVFVDPQRINHDLESDLDSTVTTGTFSVTDSRERVDYENTPSLGEDVSSSSDESLLSEEDVLFPSQRLSRDKDSPTTFSLLPTSFTSSTAENTATPKPMITTRSSITTTITSSITSTKSLPHDTLVTSLLPYTVATTKLNGTENEIAEKLFGKLNDSSTNTLMRVMKQADNNETVRQLVLLLIRHCSDPANKTLQREREELLNALLRLPVNEFSSEESKNAVAGINQLSLPAVRSINYAKSTSTAPLVTDPPVTTFRSRKSRKFRTTTENSASIVRRSEKTATLDENNSLQEDETVASDNRALELLRSLYTIATKWG
ncbi:mucin-3A-like isoform X3 [Bombus affinis]|uniref:mucin-3A-like isoform X3 n=1 Tax=Bombus affinis TaxID=309941 RepID=UPI0021B83C41|nr:mucin-3A-like isoform X3 [Bombus affinis]